MPHERCTYINEPNLFNDVWFTYTADFTGSLTLSTCNQADFNTKIAVYHGCETSPCPRVDDALLGCNDEFCGCAKHHTSKVTVGVVGGDCYTIRLGSPWPQAETGEGEGILTLSVAARPPPLDACRAPFNIEVTQNTDNTLIDLLMVTCGAGISAGETYARAFDLSMGDTAGEDFAINCVEYAMQNTGCTLIGDVTIYLDTDGGEPQAPGLDLTPLGSRQFTLPAETQMQLFQSVFDPPVVAPADSTVVVAIDTPVHSNGVAVPAGNSAGQSRCTYLLTEPCGINTFTCLDEFGFDFIHILMTLRGDLAGKPCAADLDGDGTIGILDLLALLAAWATDPGGPPDFDGDGSVGILDLLALLANWGPCP